MASSGVSGAAAASIHPTTPPPRRQGITSITIGAGTHLVLFDDLYLRFSPFGYTRLQFKLFLKALGCPVLHTPSGELFVNLLSFQLAINAATRIGQKDLLSPGTYTNKKRSEQPRNSTRTLSAEYVHDHFTDLIAELLCARKSDHALNTTAVRSAFNDAACRLAASLTRIANATHVRANRRTRARASREGVLPPFPDCSPTLPTSDADPA